MNLGSLSTRAVLGNTIGYHELRDRCIDLIAEHGKSHRGLAGAYFHSNGKPGCLLGALAAEGGATKGQLDVYRANRGGVSELTSLGYLIPEDNQTVVALHQLQSYNDQGVTWYTAVGHVFGMSKAELDRQIELRRAPKVEINVERYLDWVESYAEGEAKMTKVVDFNLCVATPVLEHALAA